MDFLLRWVRSLVLLGCGILCALAIAVVLIEQQVMIRSQLRLYIQSMLSQSFCAPIRLSMGRIRLIHEYASVERITIGEASMPWSIAIGSMILRFSWRGLIKDRSLHLTVELYDVVINTALEGTQLALEEPLRRLFASTATGGAIVVDRVIIHAATLKAASPQWSLTLEGGASIPCTPYAGMLRLWCRDGYARYHDTCILDDIVIQYDADSVRKVARADLRCNIALLRHVFDVSKRSLSIAAKKQHGAWSVQLHGADDLCQGSVDFDQCADTVRGMVRVPVDYLLACVGKKTYGATGDLVVTAEGSVSEGINGLLLKGEIDPLRIDSLGIAMRCSAQLAWDDRVPQLMLRVDRLLKSSLLITTWHTKGTSYARLMLDNDLALPLGYRLLARDSKITVSYDHNGLFTLDYCYFLYHDDDTQGLVQQLAGTVRSDGDQYSLKGSLGDYRYHGVGTLLPHGALSRLFCEHKGIPLIDLRPTDEGAVAGIIDYQLGSRLAALCGVHIPGAGVCDVEGVIAQDSIELRYAMKDANIKIPHLYNMIEGLSGSISCTPSRRLLRLHDLRCALHRGTIAVSEGVVQYDTSGGLDFLYMPWLMNECLVSWGKDVFAEFSGAGIFDYRKNRGSRAAGMVVVDRMHMRSNIFSPDIVRQMRGNSSQAASQGERSPTGDVWCDIKFVTRKPLHVKTSFLEASALGAVRLLGHHSALRAQGFVSLVQGAFLFPYKPLFITRGVITLSPQAIDDTLLDVVAENSVKGYNIRLHISGTVQDPLIAFQATPYLPEEQIIGLLWGGSEDGALYLAMSATIMKSIERLILGPSDASSGLMQSLQSIFRPLGSVRFVPSFTDQSGRGGLRGSLAIEVDDRLRGIIKQNFDLPQDTMLEVEYTISDDARVRAVKDERGDLGGEFEASWKW